MGSERAIRILFACVCLLLAFVFAGMDRAEAVQRKKYVGCVINGKLHCVYKHPDRVEVLTVSGAALMGYEGKKVSVEGKLNTIDSSLTEVYSGNVKLIGPCDKDTKRAITGFTSSFRFDE
ncbi:MAG: hypothetical protein LLG06_13645 [Desulfobacteraceae bacterium]|nr:hypothetical protein [Desulfobacteraceae bacterium]